MTDESDGSKPPTDQAMSLRDVLGTLEALYEKKRFSKLDYYEPFPKQRTFHDMGQKKSERLFMAGNQIGKTYAGAAETAFHATGHYPDDWRGRRFKHPIKAWVCGKSTTLCRDGPQSLLCGTVGVESDHGTGLLPRAAFADKPSKLHGTTDAYDQVQIRHVSGGISIINFKSYESGREMFQSATLDFIWLDEEPPMEVYTECLARITDTKGMMFMTFTPLKGKTEIWKRFKLTPGPENGVVQMSIYESPRYTKEEVEKIASRYLPWQRATRLNGDVAQGEGSVFLIDPTTIMEERLVEIPSYWRKIWGIDFGIRHPFAAVLLIHDRDNDIVHVHHAFKITDQTPLYHAVQIRQIGAAVPVAWPQDGAAREKGSGQPVAALYKAQGLRMLPKHATFIDGSLSTEAAVQQMIDRMMTGRLKVAKHLQEWFEEMAFYHVEDDSIVHEHDDLLSATQKALMMLRFAQPVALGPAKIVYRGHNDRGTMAQGLTFSDEDI